MADTAYNVKYRDEWIHGFEKTQALLRNTVTTETMDMDRGARQAVFLVATSNREAVTRGPNGLIPASADDLSQPTVTLEEKHDLPQKTRFNVFVGQSNQRTMMQVTSRAVINRDIDNEIIDALDTATQDVGGSGQIMTKGLVNLATTTLWNGHVPNDGNTFGLLTPAAWSELSDLDNFTSIDFVNGKPLVAGAPTANGPAAAMWMGIRWIMITGSATTGGLPGAGTSDAHCFIYHKSAVGHAYNDIQALAGYNEEQDYSWARTTLYHGALLLQNTGVVVVHHDDTAIGSAS